MDVRLRILLVFVRVIRMGGVIHKKTNLCLSSTKQLPFQLDTQSRCQRLWRNQVLVVTNLSTHRVSKILVLELRITLVCED